MHKSLFYLMDLYYLLYASLLRPKALYEQSKWLSEYTCNDASPKDIWHVPPLRRH